MNHYDHFIGNYRRKTLTLSLVEHGAYRLLLDAYYADERPFDREYELLYRICSAITKEEQAAVRKVADLYFPLGTDGKRHNERADEEIPEARKRIEAARTNGSKGGRPARKENPAETQRVTQSDTQRDTQQGTETITQSKPTGQPSRVPTGKATQYAVGTALNQVATPTSTAAVDNPAANRNLPDGKQPVNGEKHIPKLSRNATDDDIVRVGREIGVEANRGEEMEAYRNRVWQKIGELHRGTH